MEFYVKERKKAHSVNLSVAVNTVKYLNKKCDYKLKSLTATFRRRLIVE